MTPLSYPFTPSKAYGWGHEEKALKYKLMNEWHYTTYDTSYQWTKSHNDNVH